MTGKQFLLHNLFSFKPHVIPRFLKKFQFWYLFPQFVLSSVHRRHVFLSPHPQPHISPSCLDSKFPLYSLYPPRPQIPLSLSHLRSVVFFSFTSAGLQFYSIAVSSLFTFHLPILTLGCAFWGFFVFVLTFFFFFLVQCLS